MNKKHRKSACFLIVLIALILHLQVICFAQTREPKNEADIRVLIGQIFGNNDKLFDEADNILNKLDERWDPVLLDIVRKKGDACLRHYAAQLAITRFARKKNVKEAVNAIVEFVVSDDVSSNTKSARECRSDAADMLGFSGDGIRALTQMLKHKSLFVRQTAVSALGLLDEFHIADDDSEKYDEAYKAFEAAIPAIAAIARREKGKIKDKAYLALFYLRNEETAVGRLAENEFKKLPKYNFPKPRVDRPDPTK